MYPESQAPVLMVTGASGQLGAELCRRLAPLGRVVALDRSACDISDRDAVGAAVRQHMPSVIVNAAAYTAVDQAELDPAGAYAVNASGPAALAKAAGDVGSLLVHYSTDYVFDGRKGEPYTEADFPNPLSIYGKSKLAGDQAVLGSGACCLVLRTSWVAGRDGQNFVKNVLRLGRSQLELRVVADQRGTPTTSKLIASTTASIIGQYWLRGDPKRFASGLYHLTAQGDTTWHGYAVEILSYARVRGVDLLVSPDAVRPVTSAEYKIIASRPADSRLDSARIRLAFGIEIPDWRSDVRQLIDDLLSDDEGMIHA